MRGLALTHLFGETPPPRQNCYLVSTLLICLQFLVAKGNGCGAVSISHQSSCLTCRAGMSVPNCPPGKGSPQSHQATGDKLRLRGLRFPSVFPRCDLALSSGVPGPWKVSRGRVGDRGGVDQSDLRGDRKGGILTLSAEAGADILPQGCRLIIFFPLAWPLAPASASIVCVFLSLLCR